MMEISEPLCEELWQSNLDVSIPSGFNIEQISYQAKFSKKTGVSMRKA